MKNNIKKIIIYGFVFFMTIGLTCCEDDKGWSENYDIEWPVSTITGFSPATARPGETITITGTNLNYVLNVYIGQLSCQIDNDRSATQLTITVHPQVTDPSEVSILNCYDRVFVSKAGLFIPIIEDVIPDIEE